ncbi:ABC transporter permease [Lactobacillus juensis]|uniref:ABC transporter permease n=1 Tax=Lactobacillus juensis TaxID=3082862 RepID=UPI0030C6CC34
MIKTYFSVSKISLKSILANKSSVIILLLQALVPSLVMFYLWSLILNHGQTIGGFSKNQMVIYYIGVNFINSFVWYAVDWELNDDIHSGELSNIIHRPITIEKYYFAKMLGDRLANLILLAPILIIGFIYIVARNLIHISLLVLLEFAFSLIMAAILWFLFSYIIGSVAYWFDNLFFVLLVKEVVVNLLAGFYFPLEILPPFLVKIIKLLPFQYFSSFPIDTLVKALPLNIWLKNTIIEIVWMIVFYLIVKIVNKEGLQRYSDVMG